MILFVFVGFSEVMTLDVDYIVVVLIFIWCKLEMYEGKFSDKEIQYSSAKGNEKVGNIIFNLV